MLFSLAIIFLSALFLSFVFSKIKLPSIIGMLLTGIILGPYALNLISGELLDISSQLRQIALIIILTRAGLNLDINDLKKVGRPAILMCFVPACLEILGMVLLAPLFFEISRLDAAIMGCVVAAVSPAIVVPRMIKLIETRYGESKHIPQMLMAASSVDDVFVIVLFTAFTALATGENVSAINLLSIPTSIIFGLLGGVLIGLFLAFFFKKCKIRDSHKIIIIMSTAFLLLKFEEGFSGAIGFSALLAVIALGGTLKQKCSVVSQRLSEKYSKLWVVAEILLFVLVGATVNISYALNAGIKAIILIFCVLVFRILGVIVCQIKTNLTFKERLFTAFSYMPKATVQAAIGSIPLTMGLSCGNIVLTVAVLAILITAPLGATLIDLSYKKLLIKS